VWAPLLNGGTLVVVDQATLLEPQAFATYLQQQRVSVLWLTVGLFNEYAEALGHVLPQLRYLIVGGDALDAAVIRRVLASNAPQQLINGYGPTESTVFALTHAVKELAQDAHSVPIGRPIANTRVYVLDAQGQPVPIGVAGEIHIGGDGVALGYLNRPELTAERFVADPFHGGRMYRSGDLGRWRADGTIEFLGRNDAQVKIRGFRIEPGEIEAKLVQQPGIREAVVLAREDEPGHKQLVAYVVAGEARIDTVQLRQALAQRLPEYMLPAAFVQLERLPLTPNGKLDRAALPAPPSTVPSGGYVEPRNDREAALAAIWAQVLKLERVGIHDNFFDIGGDSIRAVSVLSKAKKKGIVCAVIDLFTHQTIARLVQAIDQAQAPQQQEPARQAAPLLNEADRARLPAGIEDAYPVTLLQTGMVFHNQLDADAAQYHDVFSYRLTLAAWSEPAMRAVLDALARKHPVLRTALDFRGYSEPLQLVHAHAQLPMTVTDLSALPGPEQDALIAQFVEAERKTPFVLEEPPLFRVFIHRRSRNVVQLTVSFHHAILDGWSLAALQTELFQEYLKLLATGGTSLRLAPLAVTAGEVAARERSALASAPHRAFWASCLEGHVFCALPLYEGEPGRKAPAQLNLEVVVADDVRVRLNAVASRLAVPMRSVLLCAHMRVVSILSGQSDVTTGLVSNVRLEQTDGDAVLGLFLNTLPFRQVLARATWAELIRQTFDAELGLIRHREYPYFQIYLDNGRLPLYEVTFNYINFHVYEALEQASGLEIVEEHSLEVTNFPVIVHASDSSSRLVLTIQAEGRRLSAQQVERMRDCYLSVLEAIAADAGAYHDERDFLPEAERHRLLVEWNATEAEVPQACVHEQFEAQAARTPRAIALVQGDERLSYAELNAQANQLARRLRELGVVPDSRVALYAQRSPRMVVGMLAVLKAGGAYVPLDPDYPAERLKHMLQDSAPQVLLTDAALPLAGGSLAMPVLHLRNDASQWAGHPAGDLPRAETGLQPGHLAYVIYTSGSTGMPKGVAMPHAPLVNLVRWDAGDAAARPRTLQFAALGFDVAFQEIFTALCAGAELELVGADIRLDFERLFEHICRRGIERLYLPYVALQHLAEAVGHAHGATCRLRDVITAGEQLRITPAIQRFFASLNGCRLHNHYGPTETHVVTAFTLPPDPACWPSLPPIGRPIPNARIYLLDGHRRPVARGVTGELFIGGGAVARGYLGRPELTAERFVDDPFHGGRMYRTGDLARHLPDGNIEFLGRNDAQVKIRGFRVELGEIETRLAQQPGVREAVVLAREDVPGARRLVAYWAGDAGLDTEALRASLAGTLPEYMLPVAYVRLERLPLSPNGKLDRKALPAPDAQAYAVRAYEAPQGKVESALAGMWGELLQLDQVGRHDDFLKLGGHSLLSVRLMARVEREFGVKFSLPQFFAQPVLAAMARQVIHARLARFAPADLQALAAHGHTPAEGRTPG
jgi:amino acid adenylation domain-containing protein